MHMLASATFDGFAIDGPLGHHFLQFGDSSETAGAEDDTFGHLAGGIRMDKMVKKMVNTMVNHCQWWRKG